MMGKQVFAPKLYYQLSLDQLVPQNHLLRQIANAVDFSFVYPLAKSHYSHTGQPSVDPVVIFKTILIGYLYGITSERRLMSEIQVNLAYRWFLGYDFDATIPDHSVLTKARSRFGMDVFEKFFEHSIQLCKQAGLLGDGPVYVDATHVGAAASLESLVKREEYVNPPMPVKDYIQKVYQENPAPREEDGTKNSPPSNGKTAPRYETWVNFDHELQKRSRSNKNREYVSYTDPESTIIHSIRGGLKLAYKAHMAVSGERGLVVTAAIATTGIIGEEHLLEEVLKCHTRYTKTPTKEVVADTRYGTLENYISLEKAGIAAYIPPHERTNGINGFWGKDHFQYIPEQDIYLCPAGEIMKNAGLCQYNRRITYRCLPGTCQSCRLNKQCTKEGHSRIVTRFVNQRLVEEARERTGNPLGKELMRQRKTRVEGIFALGKELHGMRRTRLMGRWKVQIQLWMTAIVINLKRAVKALNNQIGQEKSSNQFGSLPLDVTVTNLTFTLAYISSD
jgi:transposase